MLDWAPEATKQENNGEHIQGSEAWLKWRGRGLGSSDAAVLLGWSPWKTIEQLYEEKLGLWKPTFGPQQMSAMQRGKDLEPYIREWYEMHYGKGFRFPDAIATYPENEYLRTSFDGINRDFPNPDGTKGRLIEIKAPNKKDHAGAMLGEIPEKYEPQCQWHLLVAMIPWGDYVSRGSDGTNAVVPFATDAVMQQELRKRAEIFRKHVETRTPIPEWPRWERPLPTTLVLESVQVTTGGIEPAIVKEELPAIADQEVEALVAEALKAQEEADAATARFEALKEKLKKLAGDAECVTRGEAVFGWNERKGNVNYKVIPELIGIDLEQFRGKPVKVFYFKRRVDAVSKG